MYLLPDICFLLKNLCFFTVDYISVYLRCLIGDWAEISVILLAEDHGMGLLPVIIPLLAKEDVRCIRLNIKKRSTVLH
jgi:hypothetical protein